MPGVRVAERYRIVGLVGRGVMGEVYRADDLKLGQAVALKFLPERVEKDADRLSRFLNEVKIARQVSHPNVCRVYDVFETQGRHFISMEFVDGEDLAALLRRIGRLPRDKAIQIARQLCAGLAAAHEQGVLHSLKPANVMIDGRGRARITDFGLARLAGENGDGEARAGTPAYMAPEQLAGKEASVRSDLYALGLVLYELFTGRMAFKATTPGDMQRLQRETTPASPSEVIQGFDPVVERVLLRCLETDARDRPASALAVAAALPGGNLRRFEAVPPERDDAGGPWPVPDWSRCFSEAGLDAAGFRRVDPAWTPPAYADIRAAWEDSYTGRTNLPIGAFLALGVVLSDPGGANPYLNIAVSLLAITTIVVLLFRFGLLTLVVASIVHTFLTHYPLTLDLSSWYAGNTVLVAVVTAVLAAYGLRVSLAGRPIYRDAVLET